MKRIITTSIVVLILISVLSTTAFAFVGSWTIANYELDQWGWMNYYSPIKSESKYKLTLKATHVTPSKYLTVELNRVPINIFDPWYGFGARDYQCDSVLRVASWTNITRDRTCETKYFDNNNGNIIIQNITNQFYN